MPLPLPRRPTIYRKAGMTDVLPSLPFSPTALLASYYAFSPRSLSLLDSPIQRSMLGFAWTERIDTGEILRFEDCNLGLGDGGLGLELGGLESRTCTRY
jgi:hypothetical protein